MRSVRTAVGALTTAILLWPGLQVLAEPTTAEPTPAGPSAAMQAANPDPAPSAGARTEPDSTMAFAGFGKPMASDRLEDIRGGAEVVVNDMRLSGTVADNSATRVFTGSNAINEGSFANASGLPTVIQNTGANTLIQNATIINVQFKP